MNNTFSYCKFSVILFSIFFLSTSPGLAEQIICPDVKLAEQGSPLDEFYLGKAYDEGYCGIAVDKIQAEQWYLKSAAQDHMLAEYELGETYFTGDGVTIDYPKAKKWYQAAAEQGHGLSELRLGFLNAEAHFEGLTVDFAEAEKWFTKAAEQNAGDAQFRLGNFYNNYKEPPDYGKGFIWLKRAAEGGHRIAMFDLGRIFLEGKGVARNTEQGIEWIRKAADADVLQAQMTLVELYADGSVIKKNPAEAFRWILKIANKETSSTFYLNKAGDIFFDGWDKMPKNYPAARKYYNRAAAKGDAHALERLAQIYEQGLGVEKDPAMAATLRAKMGSKKP